MPGKPHKYKLSVEWTGNRGTGTATYAGYDRDHLIECGNKPPIEGSSDPAFRGDASKWNPEELLLASISACHKLWYLHLCASAGISVIRYRDDAEATMIEDSDGAGRFVAAALRPHVIISAGGDPVHASQLHDQAHRFCFIANSVNFAISCMPIIVVEHADA